MNQWNFDIIMLFTLFLLIIGISICIILFVFKRGKKLNNKALIVALIINILLLAATVLYSSSHPTYYRYNDWSILDSNIHMVEQKYGEFDLGEIRENQKGSAAYYIYTDNSPIMPDHLKHYYYMEYDEWGVIYNVYDGMSAGRLTNSSFAL